MYMCACIHTYIYVCICVCVCVCVYVYIYIYTHTQREIEKEIENHISKYVQTCIHIHLFMSCVQANDCPALDVDSKPMTVCRICNGRNLRASMCVCVCVFLRASDVQRACVYVIVTVIMDLHP